MRKPVKMERSLILIYNFYTLDDWREPAWIVGRGEVGC